MIFMVLLVCISTAWYILNSRSTFSFIFKKLEDVWLAREAVCALNEDHLPVEKGSYSSGMIVVCVV